MGLDCVLVGVALEEAFAVAGYLFGPAVGGIVDAADGDEAAGASFDLGGEDLGVSAAEGVEDAVVGDGLGDKFSGGLEGLCVVCVDFGL